MGKSLTSFANRRLRNFAWLGLAVVVLSAGYGTYGLTMHRPAFLTGWLLLALVLSLALLNLRKRVSMLPIGNASTWVQLHVYGGWLATIVFLVHVGLHWPTGALEVLLGLSFVLVAASGVLGIFWSRRLPNRLTRRGEEVIFERIPGFMVQLQQQAERTVETAALDDGSATLADYYRDHLVAFFSGPRHFWDHLTGSSQQVYSMLNQLDAVKRLLNDNERAQHTLLRELVQTKDELDFHYALQFALKAWLFVHVPVTGVMLMLAIVHAITAGAFGGGF